MGEKQIFFALLRCQFHNKDLPKEVKDALSDEKVLCDLYRLSKKYDLAHIVAEVLDKHGLLGDNAVSKFFLQQRNLAVYRSEQMCYEREQIANLFTSLGIQFIFLKGSVIREYYPKEWMRTSCDIDVLIHEEDIDKALKAINDLGYQNEERSYRDIVLIAPSGVHIELHFSIKQAIKEVDVLLDRVWEYVEEGTSKYNCRLTNSFFYFHNIAHMAYHFRRGGCGVRPFLDLWLLERELEKDEDQLLKFCKEGKIDSFYKASKALARVWFEEEEPSPELEEMQDYLLTSGLYGSVENHVIIKKIQKGGSLGYLWSRLFLPYEVLKEYYPRLKRNKWLFPFYQIKRWFGVFSKKRKRRITAELAVKSSKEKTQKIEALMKYVDLQ